MSGDMLSRWLLLGEVLTEEQLESLVGVAEHLVDPLARGSTEIAAVSKTDRKALTRDALVSTTYKHDDDASIGRKSD